MNKNIAVTILAFVAPLSMFASDGAALYKSKCAACHGADGGGQTPMGKSMKLRDLRSAEVQKMTDKELVTLISDGKGKMPAYKAKMSQAEIDAVVSYIHSLAKK